MPLTLVTWNIFNHEPTLAARLLLIARVLEEAAADVVAIQEAPAEGGVEFALAREIGYDVVASTPFVRPDDGWSERLAVLSRLPITEFEPIELRPGVTNALRVRVAAPMGRLDLYNVHQHPRDESLRERELAEVVAAAKARSAVMPVIAGDFNASPDSPVFRAAGDLRSAYEIANGEHPARTFATPLRQDMDPRPAAALDHVLVDPSRVRVIEAATIGEAGANGQWPSDHWGLRVVLERRG